MIAIRATYDGKDIKPSEPLPEVNREVPVAIVFLENTLQIHTPEKSQREIIEEMWAARAKIRPIGISIPEMIEEGRER